jgi:transcriptional regulator with XRE-family HTH domain
VTARAPVSETKILRQLAAQIKFQRRAKGWSQQQLAERSSMQRSYVADLERGCRNPSVRTLIKIANAIGISLVELFVETPIQLNPSRAKSADGTR